MTFFEALVRAWRALGILVIAGIAVTLFFQAQERSEKRANFATQCAIGETAARNFHVALSDAAVSLSEQHVNTLDGPIRSVISNAQEDALAQATNDVLAHRNCFSPCPEYGTDAGANSTACRYEIYYDVFTFMPDYGAATSNFSPGQRAQSKVETAAALDLALCIRDALESNIYLNTARLCWET